MCDVLNLARVHVQHDPAATSVGVVDDDLSWPPTGSSRVPAELLDEVVMDDGRMLEMAPRSSPAPRRTRRRAGPDCRRVAVDLDVRPRSATAWAEGGHQDLTPTKVRKRLGIERDPVYSWMAEHSHPRFADFQLTTYHHCGRRRSRDYAASEARQRSSSGGWYALAACCTRRRLVLARPPEQMTARPLERLRVLSRAGPSCAPS
jgi:hypothetical protein